MKFQQYSEFFAYVVMEQSFLCYHLILLFNKKTRRIKHEI
jgi:hypothetical protein